MLWSQSWIAAVLAMILCLGSASAEPFRFMTDPPLAPARPYENAAAVFPAVRG